MLRYDSLGALLDDLGTAPKWQAVAEAVRSTGRVLPEVTCSVGALVTFRVTTRPDRPELTAHRRYLDVRTVTEGQLRVEVAPTDQLTPTAPYDDLTDRQPFAGVGSVEELAAGEFLVVGADEAVRDVEVSGQILILRVSVEAPAPERGRVAAR